MSYFGREFAWIVVLTVVLLAFLVGGAVGIAALPMLRQEDVTITVNEKERVAYGEDSKYLIWTDDEVFENTDALLMGKFNSSDLYGKLVKGKTYNCQAIGWRIPFLSMYRNLVNCEEVKE